MIVYAEHLHNHLIINSVSFVTGLKLQEGPNSLVNLRKMSDEICQRHGLSVLKPYQREIGGVQEITSREYRIAEKGESWKLRLMSVIDKAMAGSLTKREFIDDLAAIGYGVKWADNLSHITYTTPGGRKCRDNKLHEEKYLKGRMERYFYEKKLGRAENVEQRDGGGRKTSTRAISDARGDYGHCGGNSFRYGEENGIGHEERNAGRVSGVLRNYQGAELGVFRNDLRKRTQTPDGRFPDGAKENGLGVAGNLEGTGEAADTTAVEMARSWYDGRNRDLGGLDGFEGDLDEMEDYGEGEPDNNDEEWDEEY